MGHQVVIIGAGYAGLPAAKRLARQVRPDEVTVTLVSAFGDFVERPRLHQLAVGQNIEAMPLRRYLEGSGVRLIAASVTGIDLDAREVCTTDERGRRSAVRYDTLVYALGSNIDLTSVAGCRATLHHPRRPVRGGGVARPTDQPWPPAPRSPCVAAG